VNIAVAMSGGVDSSVAAALLKEEGHDLIGVTMNLLPRADGKNENGSIGETRAAEAVAKAKEVAVKLGIPHYTIDLREFFQVSMRWVGPRIPVSDVIVMSYSVLCWKKSGNLVLIL
jgi:tRNA-specific 2-thiouridylase